MTFIINKNNNGQIIRKTLNNNVLATVNNSDSLGSSYSIFTTNASSLTLNNTIVTADVTELNKTIVTPGTGTASKLLVLNSSKNISNINNLECNSITINGTTLNGLSSNNQNLYLNNIIEGTGSGSRALVLDNNRNINNINKISTNNIEIGDGLIDMSGKNKKLIFNSGNITTLNNWTFICWADSLNLFVAVSNEGNNNRIITSPDGINWTVRVSPIDNNWTSVCWSQQLTLLVAVSNSGTGNRIMTSSDGINWTIQTSPADNNWTSICWSSKLTLFVAVASSGTDNRIMTSTDGINWTLRTSPNNFNWNSVCWSPDLNIFTAVGYSNIVSNTFSGPISNDMTSNNSSGKITTASSYYSSVYPQYASSWDPWNAFDNNSSTGYHSLENQYNSSSGIYTANLTNTTDSNGTVHSGEWIQIQLSTTIILSSFSITPRAISNFETQRAPRSFVILGSTNGSTWNLIYTETNKNNWTSSASTFTINNNTNSYNYYRMVVKRVGNLDSGMTLGDCINIIEWNLIASSGIALANSVMTSVNGSDWTLRSIDNVNWQSVCWSYDLYKFIAVANSGTNRIAMSSDGTNWSSNAIIYNNNWNNIIWAPEYKMLIVSTNNTNNGAKLIYSYNGLIWYPLPIPKNYNINCLTYSNTLKKICCITNKNLDFTFTKYNAPNNNTIGIQDIAWSSSLQLYVAVGFSGKIMTSTDGITWTNRTGGTNFNYLLVEWSPTLNLFLAITQVTNNYSTSPDGITWTNRILPTTLWWKNLVWSSNFNIFILNQLYGTQVYTTSDGINWTLRNTTGNNLRIKWISNLNLFIGISNNHISTSPDAITWTSRTVPEANNWIDFDYSPSLNLLIAVSSNGTNRMITSSNGINWTISNNISSRPWKIINWNNYLNMFILISSNNNNNSSFYSLDGIIWNNLNNNLNNTINKLLFNNTLNQIIAGSTDNVNSQIYLLNLNNSYVINSFINNTYSNSNYKYNLSNNVNKIYTKKSNIKYGLKNWYTISYTTSDSWVSCCFGGYPLNDFVAVSNTGNIIMSADGNNWSSVYTSTNNYNSVCWSPELQLFVAVGSAGNNRAITSSNGSSWTLRNLTILNNWTSICWSPELMIFVAVSSSGNYRVAISDNGIDWKSIKCPINNWTSVCWSPELNLFVAISNSGINNRVMTSINGIEWEFRISAVDNNWTSICWSKHLNLFVAVANSGTNNRIMTSNNGINWNSQISPADNNWNSIIWINSLKIFVSIASSGSNRLMYSYDGINWNLITLSVNNNWNSICWSEEFNYLLMVSSTGNNDRIYRSYFFNSTDFNTIFLRGLTETNNKLRYWVPYNFTGSPTHQLEVSNNYFTCYNTSGTAISRFTHNGTNFYLNFVSTSSINISDHNGIDSGLALNNVLVTATGNQINTLSGLILGQSIKNKPLSLDSNLNLINLNQLSCNTLNLSPIFNNIVSGTALGYNLITTDNNKNVNNLNTVSTNIIKVKNSDISNNSISLLNNDMYQTIFNKSNILYNFGSTTSICWSPELSLFAAISSGNNANSIALSSNGIDWITYSLNNTNGFTTICWSSTLKLFVAIALNTNVFYYSSNGITWNTSTFSLTYNWQSVIWSSELNMFAAVARSASNGTSIATSVDGINWISRTAPDNQWWQIIYAKNRFIVIGTIGIMTSTDGIVWTNGTVPASHNWKSITYSSSLDLFVIVSDTGSNRIAYSSNLTTWTLITAPILNSWLNVLWIDELNIFIATSSTGTNNRIMISDNGINWYIRSHNNQYLAFVYRCAWSPSLKRLVLPTSTNYVYCSDFRINNLLNKNIYLNDLNKKASKYEDIIFNLSNNWISRNAASNLEWEAICYSTELNLFVAISDTGTGNRIMTSNDSINWTSQVNPVDNNWTSICYSSNLNLFVAVSNTGTNDRIMTSSDGITWTSRNNPVDNNWTSICYSSELSLFVAVASSGTNDRIMTSSDGINWTTRNNPVDNNWTSICYSPELTLFVAVANTGTNDRVMTSIDGINWTSRTSAANNNWISICWANNINLFIAIANSGNKRIMISEDGINWNLIQDPVNNNWKQIIWINELNSAVAISNSGTKRIMISLNGYDWKLENLTIQNNFTSICWSPKLAILVLVSNSGTNRVISSVIGYATETNSIVGYPNQLTINNITENIGLGTNTPSYRLHLSTDSAAKLSSSTWTVSSDIRLKENIETADLDLCYNNVKNLPLKRYTWKNEIYNDNEVNDRSKLGWIADDVELIFPKSIKKNNLFDIEDCKTLNNDQIIASLYGTIKKLINISENNNNIINNLENQYNSLKTSIDSLEIIE
jgi:hypothetical protein